MRYCLCCLWWWDTSWSFRSSIPIWSLTGDIRSDQIPIVYLVGGMASLLSALVLGRVSDKLGKLKVFTFSVALSLIMVYGITNMPPVPFLSCLLFFIAWFIFATGRGVTAQAMVSNVVEKEQQGSFMVLNSSMQHAGTFLASIAAGYVVIENKNGNSALNGSVMRASWCWSSAYCLRENYSGIWIRRRMLLYRKTYLSNL